jgi:hypothetical protein
MKPSKPAAAKPTTPKRPMNKAAPKPAPKKTTTGRGLLEATPDAVDAAAPR